MPDLFCYLLQVLLVQNYLRVSEKKYLVVGNEEEEPVVEEENCDMPRKNILLKKLPTPKMVRLPNGRTFYAKYARVTRNQLPQNIRVRRAYVRKIGPRRQRKRRKQGGRGLLLSKALLSLAFDLTKREGNSKLGQMIIKRAIDFVPTAYAKIKNRFKKKKTKKADTGGGDYDLIGEDFN